MPTASSLAWKTSLSEVKDAVALQQIKERGALYDWSWWYPSGNRPLQQYLGFTAGRWLWWFEHKADSLIAKFKEAGGTVREIDVWAESTIISALVICIIVCLSWAVNHYRDNAITYKTSATKMPVKSWRTRQLLTCRCVSVMLLRSVSEGVSWCSTKWCSAWWCCRWSSSVAHQSSLSVSAWSHPRRG